MSIRLPCLLAAVAFAAGCEPLHCPEDAGFAELRPGQVILGDPNELAAAGVTAPTSGTRAWLSDAGELRISRSSSSLNFTAGESAQLKNPGSMQCGQTVTLDGTGSSHYSPKVSFGAYDATGPVVGRVQQLDTRGLFSFDVTGTLTKNDRTSLAFEMKGVARK